METFASSTSCSVMDQKSIDCHHSTVNTDFSIGLSDEGKQIIEFVNCMAICSLTVLFGTGANIINIIIFYKQGFANTVNIAFFGLAVSDLCCVISLGWASVCLNPLLPDFNWVVLEVMILSVAWPHACFCRITSYITVYITAERFISIALPLKVKQIVTAKRTTLIICLIYIVNITTLIPEYATSSLGWKLLPAKNRTLLGIVYTSSRNDYAGLCLIIHVLLSATAFVAVIIFTCLLANKLKQSSQWRIEVGSSHQQNESVSNKERKTVKMIVVIASILIMCYTPGAVIAMAMFIVGPELSITGRYSNMCEAASTVAYVSQSINSSVNIFLYYKMSTKYRQTFDDLFQKVFTNVKNAGLHI